jgi:hypothetical protein
MTMSDKLLANTMCLYLGHTLIYKQQLSLMFIMYNPG